MGCVGNYGSAVPGGGPGRLAAVSTTVIAGRDLPPPRRTHHVEEFRSELFELHRRSRPVNALRQPLRAPATRRDLAGDPQTHDTGWGRLP
jgi:hypothetical protein